MYIKVFFLKTSKQWEMKKGQLTLLVHKHSTFGNFELCMIMWLYSIFWKPLTKLVSYKVVNSPLRKLTQGRGGRGAKFQRFKGMANAPLQKWQESKHSGSVEVRDCYQEFTFCQDCVIVHVDPQHNVIVCCLN